MRAWIVAVALVLPGCSASSEAAECPAVVERDQHYGTDSPQQALDVFVPDRGEDCAAVPVVVWVHGGAFATGDKANFAADKVDLFNDAGWAFASVNYRLLDAAHAVPEPHQPQDVAAAIAWLNTHADDLGIDPTRVALAGHSAGAYLTAQVATDPAFGTSLRAAVVLDTGRFAPPRVPATILLVTRGSPARRHASAAFADAIVAAGGEATVVDAEPYRHEDVNRAVGRTRDAIVTPPLMAFLTEHLDGPERPSERGP